VSVLVQVENPLLCGECGGSEVTPLAERHSPMADGEMQPVIRRPQSRQRQRQQRQATMRRRALTVT